TKKAAREAVSATAEAAEATLDAVADGTQRATAAALETTRHAVEHTEATAAIAPRTGFTFWDAMFGLSGTSSSREVAVRGATSPAPAPRQLPGNEQVIPRAEEILVVGKRTVNTGTTRIRRYVVETPVEQQVTLVRERVVVERRRPVASKPTGETLTELTIEVVETDEVPVLAKSVQLREEIVVRTERSEHVETVRDVVRQDEMEIEPANTRQRARARG
ncbi:MAG: YsnF/AvaK domain-containing protein, partial [Acetobacteraceae bacterium]|nr:YsnF/AvaK domain-containing protein [Acetobacteraceae bacterium]